MSNVDVLALDAVDAIEGSTKPDQVYSFVQTVIEKIGYSSVAMIKMLNSGLLSQDHQLMNTRPQAFTDAYFGEHFDRVDPLLSELSRANRPFTWRSVYDRPLKPIQRRLENLAKSHGMVDGLLFVIQQVGNLGIISFAGPDFVAESDRHRSAQLVATYAYSKLNHMHYPLRPLDEPLHWRERECLSWAAAGKTDTDIAQILNLSQHSVHVYIERAKTRLGASNRTAAVVEAIRRKEIVP